MTTASEPTSVAGDAAQTIAVPGGVKTGDADLAWLLVGTAPVVPGDGRRRVPKMLPALLAGIAVAMVALGAFVFGERQSQRVNTLPMQSTSIAPSPTPAVAQPSHEVPATVIEPAARPAPRVPSATLEPPSSVTIEASPSAATDFSPPPPAPSTQLDLVRDGWLLGNLRSLGYMISNPPLVIHNAHEACHLFQQGESPEQVNQQMSAMTGMNIDDTLQLTSSAMLAYYPNCA